MGLNRKQQRFVTEYLLDQNATQAAVRAGYSAKTARQIGARLLSHVDIATAVTAQQAHHAEATGLTFESHLADLKRFRDAAFQAGEYGPAIQAEVKRGEAVGYYVKRSEDVSKLTPEEREARVLQLVKRRGFTLIKTG